MGRINRNSVPRFDYDISSSPPDVSLSGGLLHIVLNYIYMASLPLKLPSAAGIISHSTNALPKARQASSAASSGVSVQITLSQTRFTPALSQSLSHVRIHSPSPQP